MSEVEGPADRVPNRGGLDLLRSLAGYPQRAVHLGRHRVESRIVWIERDRFGNVTGSIERAEATEHTDLTGDYLD